MKYALFISAGIGNALLLIPLIKELKKTGSIVVISTSPFGSHRIFDGFENNLFEGVTILESTVERIKQTANFKRRFDVAYLDFFSSNRKNLILAHTNSKRIITNFIPDRFPSIFQQRILQHPSDVDLHESTRYLRYVIEDFKDEQLNEELFKLTPKQTAPISEKPYITLQPGSGNNLAPWKTLQLDKWLKVIHHIIEHYPDLNIVVMGDDAEVDISERLPQHPNVINAIGVTALSDLPGIMSKAVLHLGGDSALMHLAGVTGVPSISVWGGSDPRFYGWHLIHPEKHHIIHKNLECGPCSRWLKPNTSKVELPSLCPDFKCLRTISVKDITQVIDEKLTH
ncbi:MAG: glycosyltransferase family 9 protein [Salibacteraceae bacterium]